MSNNYTKQVLSARELFLKYDQKTMIHKFHLEADDGFITLPLLNQTYRISRTTGVVHINGCECLDYNVTMTLYDVLCTSKPAPTLARLWSSVSGLQATMSSPSDQIFLRKYANAFSGKLPLLKNACEQIGGHAPGFPAGSDVCWEFRLFPFLPVQFRYWDPDEEFPAQIQLLWDRNTLDFMHFETVYYAMHVLMETIHSYMGL